MVGDLGFQEAQDRSRHTPIHEPRSKSEKAIMSRRNSNPHTLLPHCSACPERFSMSMTPLLMLVHMDISSLARSFMNLRILWFSSLPLCSTTEDFPCWARVSSALLILTFCFVGRALFTFQMPNWRLYWFTL